MKLVITCLAVLALVNVAYAYEGPDGMYHPDQVNLPEVRDAIYCQQFHSGWNAGNASSGFGSEMADDIPAALAGSEVGGVTFYVAQWGAGWQDFTGFIVNFYDNQCPPEQDPAYSFNIPWASLTVTTLYEGGWVVKQVDAILPESVTLTATMSIGGLVDQNWGQNAPFCGLCFTDDYAINGCGEGYWDGDNWGAPRWTPFSAYWGTQWDLAYCLEGGAVPAEESTWGTIKGLYR